jgi:hypothetical protein
MEFLNSHQIIQNCTKNTESIIGRVLKTFSHLSEIQLNWKPHPDSWSVGECLSHLINSNNLYLNKFQTVLISYPSDQAKDFPYKQSFMGKLIAKGVDPTNVKKSKTFKVFLPDSSDIQKNIIDDYTNASEKLISLARKMIHIDLKKVRLRSPVNLLINLNLGDPLIIIPKHDERHLNQAERVMSQKEFPTR